MITLSIIIPTQGRPTLLRTLESLTPQLEDGDEILIMRRDNVPYGNATRDEAIPRCLGSHLWWIDDDDIATPNALQIIRDGVSGSPGQTHVFRMQYGGGNVLWGEKSYSCGNIGGAMMVVPNVPGKLGTWVHEGVSCGDWHFLKHTVQMQGGPVVWHEEVLQIIRPEE